LSMSIRRKFFLALIPISILGVSATGLVWRSLTVNEEKLLITQKIHNLALRSRVALVEETSSWRGTLLNPKRENEAVERVRAREEKKRTLDELKSLPLSEDIRKLTNELIDFNEKNLVLAEEKLLSLARTGSSAEALDFFNRKFFPMRSLYDELSVALMDTSVAETNHLIEERKQEIFWVLTLVGLGFLALVLIFLILSLNIWKDLRRGLRNVRNEFSDIWQMSRSAVGVGQDFSRSLTTQTTSLSATTSSIDQLRLLVAKNSKNSKIAASSTLVSMEMAKRGQSEVEKVISAMSEINTSNSRIIEKIDEGNTKFEEIVKVIHAIGAKTQMINEIVFQTKLLSFNAAIEAARAGEHGKGFSVVAEEIGNLAAMSGSASKEISAMLDGSIKTVETIVAETRRQVSIIVGAGKEKVESGAVVARACGEAIHGIVGSISEISTVTKDMSIDSDRQAAGIREIVQALGHLDQMTQQSVVESIEAASTAQNLVAQAEELNHFVKMMALTIEGPNRPAVQRPHPMLRKNIPMASIKKAKNGVARIKRVGL
jgi:methyl-accepting chemotaxis protein